MLTRYSGDTLIPDRSNIPNRVTYSWTIAQNMLKVLTAGTSPACPFTIQSANLVMACAAGFFAREGRTTPY